MALLAARPAYMNEAASSYAFPTWIVVRKAGSTAIFCFDMQEFLAQFLLTTSLCNLAGACAQLLLN